MHWFGATAAIAMALAALVVIALYYFVLKPSGWRGLRLYYKLLGPIQGSIDLESLSSELARRGVYTRLGDSGVVVDEFVEWRILVVQEGGGTNLAVEAIVKDWYVITTAAMLLSGAGTIIGLILAVVAAWRFYDRRDKIRSVLAGIPGVSQAALSL